MVIFLPPTKNWLCRILAKQVFGLVVTYFLLFTMPLQSLSVINPTNSYCSLPETMNYVNPEADLHFFSEIVFFSHLFTFTTCGVSAQMLHSKGLRKWSPIGFCWWKRKSTWKRNKGKKTQPEPCLKPLSPRGDISRLIMFDSCTMQ